MPVEAKSEQYCSDLIVVSYRNYELGKIEAVATKGIAEH